MWSRILGQRPKSLKQSTFCVVLPRNTLTLFLEKGHFWVKFYKGQRPTTGPMSSQFSLFCTPWKHQKREVYRENIENIISFYSPWKYEIRGLLIIFSGDVERDQWCKMDQYSFSVSFIVGFLQFQGVRLPFSIPFCNSLPSTTRIMLLALKSICKCSIV